MRTMIRPFYLLAVFAGYTIPASADIVTQLLPNPFQSCPCYSTATAINSAGWVVGNTFDFGIEPLFGNLWKPSGGATTPAIGLPEFDDPWAFEEWDDIDIHDNGDVLMLAFNVRPGPGTCVDSACSDGGAYAVGHFGGGPVLSNQDYVVIEDGITFEWLSTISLWGPIDPHTSNASGQFIEDFGPSPCSEDDAASGLCGAVLITPGSSVPEPTSFSLLMIAMVALGTVAWRRIKQDQGKSRLREAAHLWKWWPRAN